MTVDLTGIAADPLGDNPARVEEVMDKARELGDGVPFVLLPVRIETRFVQVEEPIGSPEAHLGDLVAVLTAAGNTLQLVATTDLATSRGDRTAKEFREFKTEVENPRMERASKRLADASEALAVADGLLRDPLDGSPEEIATGAAAAAAVRAGLDAAAAQLERVRSEHQRGRLTRELEALRAQAEPTLAAVETRALPAARLRSALAGPALAAPAGRRVIRGTADQAAGMGRGVATLKHADLARGAGTYETLLAGVGALGNDARAAAELTAATATIPLLPAKWKRTLAAAVEAARRRAPSADIDALAAAVGAIRSDDRRLDEAVPRPDLVVALPQATRTVERLLVRVYPDDIAVDTHEEALTTAERDAGEVFWQQTAMAGSDEAERRAAWRALCSGRGSRRAAWIARETEPLAHDQGPTRGARAAERVLTALTTFQKRVDEVSAATPGTHLDAVVRAAEGLVTPLTDVRPLPEWAIARIRDRYAVVRAACLRLDAASRRPPAAPDATQRAARTQLTRSLRKLDLRISRLRPETPPDPRTREPDALKDGAWTRAAAAGTLPDRFVVVTVADDGRVAHVVAGSPVPEDLKLSLDPDPADPAAETFEVGPDGDLVVGTSIRWMVDYEEAVTKGMGVTVPLTPAEAQDGFDRLYVLGVRHGRARDGAAELEAMFDNHHFGRGGLALVAQGTATNNTEAGKAGFSTDDDPDASFALELGAPSPDLDDDGSRLGRALGLRERAFAHVEGNDRHECAEARTVMAALYPATLGGWLEENAVPLISLDSRERLREFALAHVSPRGQLPAFRVGAQPYGVLPVTAHSRFVAEPREALGSGPPVPPVAAQQRQQRFDRILGQTLTKLTADWGDVRAEHVAYATDDSLSPANARERFLTLLGLDAVSSSGSYRFQVNVAGRHAPPSRAPELEFGLPPRTAGAVETGAQYGPFEFLRRFEPILRDAFQVPAGSLLTNPTDGTVTDAFAAIYGAIQDSRAYGLRMLRSQHALEGRLLPQDPAAALTALASAAPAALVNQGAGPLLAMLARQALLLAWRDAALRVLMAENLLTEQDWIETGAAGSFVIPSLLDPRTMTRWSYLLGSLGSLVGAVDLANHVGPGGTMADFVRRDGPGSYRTFVRDRSEQIAPAERTAAAVAALGAIPPERLGPLVREHLDLVSHRVDAWVTGLAQRRLTAMRERRPLGAHVGAYGWVEDLRPDVDGDTPATGVPAVLDGDLEHPVLADDDARFIHAPSVNHAVTAAILRSGYLSQGGATLPQNPMAVNLSSRRTRLALGLIDGVRAGNRLGALLGYRLERFLHEYHSQGPTLDAVISPLRQAYPSIAGVAGELSPDAAARAVCDGLAIADVANRWIAEQGIAGQTVYEALSTNLGDHPWGFAPNVLPASGDIHLDGVLRAIDHVADALDAVGDLVVAESVHQIALGNHPRAAAVMSALSKGAAPPRPEVVDTPRTGTPLTHRVLLELPPAAGAPAGWGALTPRAQAEPVLNAWVAGLLGDPDAIRVRLVGVTDDAPAGEVSMADLGLQPLDLVAIVGPGFELGLAEIGARALDAVRPASFDDVAPPAPLRVAPGRLAGWGDDVRSLDEVAPLLEAVGDVVGRGRAATARDFLLGEHGPPDGDDGVDVAELSARTTAAADELAGATVALARLIAEDPMLPAEAILSDPRAFVEEHQTVGIPLWTDRATWRAALLRVAAFGITVALPPTQFVTRVGVRDELREAAEEALVQAVPRLKQAAAALSGPAVTASALDAAARALFGEGFTILPRAVLRNRDDVAGALAARLATAGAVDGWLQGAGAVRDGVGALADLLALADAHGAATPTGAVAQLPLVAGEPWLGASVPAAGDQAGRLSLVLFGAGALPAAGAAGVSLLVDEWTEVLPAAEETGGVAVSSNQPDASPPCCVLIAVPPRIRGRWELGDLFQTLHETFELAKARSVELEHLQRTPYGQLLPTISGEVVPRAVGTPSPLDDRVYLDFGANT